MKTQVIFPQASLYNRAVMASFVNITLTVDTGNNMDAIMPNACDSNSSLWQLTSPLCSINFASFGIFVSVAVLLSIITVFTVFGNVLVGLALYRFPTLRSMSNLLIGNLALSDCLLALTVLPISTGNDLLGYWVFGEELCRVWLCIDVLYCTASIWGLCTIAVDRYTATVYPVWYYERRSPKRALVYIIFVWLFSIVVSLAPFIGWREMIPDLYKFNPVINRYSCVLFETKGYVVYSAMCSFVLPIVLMTFIYVRIFSVLRKRMKLLKPKRHIGLHLESDIDSCVIPESTSRLDLQTSATSTAQTRDQATQISPLLGKPGGNFLLEPKGYIIRNPHHASLSDVASDTTICPKMTSGENKSKCDKTQCECTEKCSNKCTKNACDDSILNNHVKNIDNNDNNKKVTKQLSLPHIVIRKSDSNESSTLENCNLSSFCHSESMASNLELESGSIGSGDNTDNRQKRRKNNKKFLQIHRNINSTKRKKDQNGKITKSSLKGKHRHLTGIKTKYELREQRATKRMAIVMACFCVCWIPFLFMYTIRSFCGESCDLNVHIQAAIIWLGYANSALNPILYTLFNDDFRKAFKTILHLNKPTQKTFKSTTTY